MSFKRASLLGPLRKVGLNTMARLLAVICERRDKQVAHTRRPTNTRGSYPLHICVCGCGGRTTCGGGVRTTCGGGGEDYVHVCVWGG